VSGYTRTMEKVKLIFGLSVTRWSGSVIEGNRSEVRVPVGPERIFIFSKLISHIRGTLNPSVFNNASSNQ
jgi:hypothetical protein